MRRVQVTPFPKQARAERERVRAYESARAHGTSHRLYCSRAWQALRADVLIDAQCAVAGCKTVPTIVDHVVPHRGDQGLFFDRKNLQAMCKRHHDSKTVRKDGGFGNATTPPVEYEEGDGFGMA